MTLNRVLLGSVFSALTFVSATGISQAATVYNAVTDFSATNGGSSVWSYGYNPTNPLAAPTLLDQYLPGSFKGQVDAYHNSNGSCCGGGTNDNSVLIGKNITSGTIQYETIVQPTTYLSEDPEGNASADLVFTAKTAGTYNVSFGFLGIDTGVAAANGGHVVDVLANGIVERSGSILTYGGTYDSTFSAYLGAGQTLDFQTLTSPNTFTNLSTGVQATVSLSTVPLPASAPLFGAALLGLGGIGYALNRRSGKPVSVSASA